MKVEQGALFREAGLPLSMTDEVAAAIAGGAVVAVGVSGGKDSQAAALAVAAHLDEVGHAGPRILVHADLGEVEWHDSLPCCRRLAEHLGWELMVVSRKAGGLLPRWQKRWADNVERYRNLECLKVIPPWSTPAMRFCTSELKTDVIASALKKRFPRQQIVSAAGIRGEESPARARMSVSKAHVKLSVRGITSYQWHPILSATKDQVFASIAAAGLTLHQAYTEYGTTRVSCRFCIMSSGGDLQAASQAAESADLYRAMCELELTSTFSFQAGRWLSMVNPVLLGAEGVGRVEKALAAASRRESAESTLPVSCMYQKGWPLRVPDAGEASAIAAVRREVADALGFDVRFVDGASVRERIGALYEEARARESSVA